jgi:hypothetical protein
VPVRITEFELAGRTRLAVPGRALPPLPEERRSSGGTALMDFVVPNDDGTHID